MSDPVIRLNLPSLKRAMPLSVSIGPKVRRGRATSFCGETA